RTRAVLVAGPAAANPIEHMRARGVRRAPVVAPPGVPVGMLSTDDLLLHIQLKVSGKAALVAGRCAPDGRVSRLTNRHTHMLEFKAPAGFMMMCPWAARHSAQLPRRPSRGQDQIHTRSCERG